MNASTAGKPSSVRDFLKSTWGCTVEQSPTNAQNVAKPTAAPCPSGNMREHTRGRSPLDVHSVEKPSCVKAPFVDTWGHKQGESLHMHAVPEGFLLALLLKEACANAQWGEALCMSAVWESFLVPHKPARTHEDTHRGATLNTRPLGETSLSLQTWNVSSALEQNLVNGTLWENLQLFHLFHTQKLRAWQKSLNGYKYGFPFLSASSSIGIPGYSFLVHVANLNT